MRSLETVVSQEKKDLISNSLTSLEGFLDGQDWFSGNENVSVADLSYLSVFAPLYHIGLDVADYPNLSAWYERCGSLPGFSENEKGAKTFAGFIRSRLTEPY